MNDATTKWKIVLMLCSSVILLTTRYGNYERQHNATIGRRLLRASRGGGCGFVVLLSFDNGRDASWQHMGGGSGCGLSAVVRGAAADILAREPGAEAGAAASAGSGIVGCAGVRAD